MRISRRGFVAFGFGAAAAALGRGEALGAGNTRLVLLGTAGGPTPKSGRSAPAQAIVVGDRVYLVDCGDGVARQLAMAGVPIGQLRAVFITHHHSDHNADYGNLLLLAWAAGLRTPVDSWGPPPLEEMTRLFFQLNAYDINTRIADEGRVPLVPLIHAHELKADGVVLNVTAESVMRLLPPLVMSEAEGRMVVERLSPLVRAFVERSSEPTAAAR